MGVIGTKRLSQESLRKEFQSSYTESHVLVDELVYMKHRIFV